MIFSLIRLSPKTRNNKKYYYDPCRKVEVVATPEELVRQKALKYLRWGLRVPAKFISVEVPMTRYGYTNNRERADIVINRAKGDELAALAVVECKAPHIPIGQAVIDQAQRYARALNAEYAFAVNGQEFVGFYYDTAKQVYAPLNRLPSYKRMCKLAQITTSQTKVGSRSSYQDIFDIRHIKQHYSSHVGEDTPTRLLPLIANIYDSLYDIKYRLQPKRYSYFTLCEDLGIRTKEYSVPGGGRFNGKYRCLKITKKDDSPCFVGFSISPYQTSAKPLKNRTALIVSIENEHTNHHALQLVMDDNIRIDEDSSLTAHITHHGRINIGRQGTGRINELKELINQNHPCLLKEGVITLGTIHNTEPLYMDSPEFEAFLENLITYSLIRDEYRAFKKAAKRQEKDHGN